MRDIRINKPKITLEGLFLSLLLFFSTFGQRIVIPLGGQQIALIFPVTLAAFITMLFSKKFSVYTIRLWIFALFWILALSFLLFQKHILLLQFFFLMLYLPFLFNFEFRDELKLKYLKDFKT